MKHTKYFHMTATSTWCGWRTLLASLLLLLAVGSAQSRTKDRATVLREKMLGGGRYVTVIAHRGDWHNHPENSLPAYRSSIAQGVDMIEIDVQMTKDSVLIIMHDHTLNRTSTGRGPISDHTYSEIQQMRLLTQHGATDTRNHIPTLREVLQLCRGKVLINIDKGYDYFPQVLQLMEETGTTEQVIIKSGHPLQKVQQENGDVLRRVTYMPIIGLDSPEAEARIDEYLTIHPVAIECCFREYTDQVSRLLRKIRQAGVQVWLNGLWPSLNAGHDDDRAVELGQPDESWGWLLSQGATLIQTDRPVELIQYLKKKKRR